MVALNFHDYLIAVTTETKPPVLKNCEEISLLYPKEKTTEQQAAIHKENSLWWNTGRQPHVSAIKRPGTDTSIASLERNPQPRYLDHALLNLRNGTIKFCTIGCPTAVIYYNKFKSKKTLRNQSNAFIKLALVL